MQYSTLVLGTTATALLSTSASATPQVLPPAAPFKISDFHVRGDWTTQLTHYHLNLTFGAHHTRCDAQNSARGDPASCPMGIAGAEVAAPFTARACADPQFRWALTDATGADGAGNARPGFELRVEFDDGTEHRCRVPRWLSGRTTAVAEGRGCRGWSSGRALCGRLRERWLYSGLGG